MAITIIGIGSYVPDKILTNFDLEKMVKTNDQWIRTRTGIAERRIAAPDQQVSDLGLEAALKALKMGNTAPEELDAIILSSTSAEYTFPATACALQYKLGNTKAFCFDVQAACTGFIFSMETARSFMIANPKLKRVLLVAAEKISSMIDWTDRDTCVLFGDAASALLLSNDDSVETDCFEGAKLGSNGVHLDKLLVPAGGSGCPATQRTIDQHLHFLKMDGPAIFKLAVSSMVECSKQLMAETMIKAEDIDWMVAHQANSRIITATAERLNIPPERVFMNVQSYGNTCAATIGLALDEMHQQGLLKKGQLLLLTAVGGGLTWGSLFLRWPLD
ncbi:MAG: ketoacyl-ACP synthase III [Victivallaceae bacterium]|nr:ketoacyl-ACP synthase III [Victivallaceae bacterium]MDD4180774.1 ketoacyl-ACP synthase III [Victivallaceae bacterium]